MGNFNNPSHLGSVVNAALVSGSAYFGSAQAHQRFMDEIESVTRKHLNDSGLATASQNEFCSGKRSGNVGYAGAAHEQIFVDLLGAAMVSLNGAPAVRTVFRAAKALTISSYKASLFMSCTSFNLAEAINLRDWGFWLLLPVPPLL